MGAIYLDWLAAELRAAGLRVVEVDHVTSAGVIVEGPAWVRRARSSGGYAAMPLCVMWHHTAVGCGPSGPAGQIRDAITRPDAAPIMNLLVWCDAVVYVLAGGATNTNGKGWAMTFSRGTVPADSMNTRAVGMELANDGVGGTYPQAQIDAAFTVSNVINRRCGNVPEDLAGHVHYTDRKIDPATAGAVAGPWRPRSINSSGSWNLDDMRAEARRRTSAPTPTPDPEPEDPDVYQAIVITAGAGSQTVGAIAVADPAFRTKTFLSATDADALRSLGMASVTIDGATFDRIPGAQKWTET